MVVGFVCSMGGCNNRKHEREKDPTFFNVVKTGKGRFL